MTTVTFTTGTGATWTVPAGVTSVQIQCWAGGGATQDNTFAGLNIGGAGGGAFSQKTALTVTPGNTITYTVGAAGTNGSSPTSGGDTSATYSASVVCLAKGGAAGTSSGAGAGGLAASGTGDVTFSGGSGHAGAGSNKGGGGGSSAGPSSNGNSAPGTPQSYTPGAAVTGGGAGGQGDTTGSGGAGPGTFPGGGAGSLSLNDTSVAGQVGAGGQISFIYTVSAASPQDAVLFGSSF